MRLLDERGMEAFSLSRSHYARVPWQQLREAVARADGVVVFGFRQLHVGAGEWRPGTVEARSAADWYATPWNQIEAGLAIMARAPVLVSGDIELSDGVFSPELWGECVFGLPPDSNPDERSKVLDRWATSVVARATGRVD